ncbi:helix-turn-helix domain-containing protein [Actinomycetospora endophytica]|uniref:Helix-turn-helix domain-containing protein n=1 Tax=Actinomycetospora endophytica TaxID=2291215 RepID=A0ABS8PH23_9PSEU|nr:helix-turn-helix domain-containing protein [Actinomycetospora endophytica]MCD2197545.1 helix-turn-helix domain-containing protein [Actinomycetospora endophytica]
MARIGEHEQAAHPEWPLDEWQDLIRTHFVSLDIRPGSEQPFRGAVDMHHIGPLSVARVRSVEQDFHRTPGLIRGDDEQYLQVGHLRQGAADLEQDGRRCRLEPGGLAVYDTSRPFTWSMTQPWVMDVFTWPRSLLTVESTTAVTARVPVGGPSTSIAAAALRQAGAGSDDVGGAEGDQLATALVDLVLCAARTDLPASAAGAPAVGLPAVLAVVDAHLRDPALDPALVARRCHLSLRSLHRLFADAPRTLAGHIRLRRLEKAREALLCEPTRPVAAIAAEFCFSDASVFARAFRDEYGHSPRACRRLALP